MNKTTEALKLAEEALVYHTQQTRPIQKTDEALAAIREALDHSGDANEMVMDWSKVKPEAIKSDPMYQMGYAAAKAEPVTISCDCGDMYERNSFGGKFIQQYGCCPNCDAAEPVKQEPVVVTNKMAFAFHRAIGDYSLSEAEVEETKVGLRNALVDYAAPVSAPKQDPVAWKEFNEWMHRELPSGTVIGDPGWWASKIYKHFIQNAAPVSAKREWVDLTDDEIWDCNVDSANARRVIAAFKDKNK